MHGLEPWWTRKGTEEVHMDVDVQVDDRSPRIAPQSASHNELSGSSCPGEAGPLIVCLGALREPEAQAHFSLQTQSMLSK